MKPWQWTVVGLALLATAGCRSDPAVPILERELRLKEDEIYRLRARLDDGQDCSLSWQGRPAGTSRSGAATESEEAAPRRRSGAGASNGTKPPLIELPSKPGTEMPDILKTPAGSMPSGIPEVPEHLKGPSKPLGRGRSPAPLEQDGPALEKGPGGVTSRSGRFSMASRPALGEPFTPSEDSRRVATIGINRTLTGGIDADDRPGDQGLLVVIEPRDRAGRAVDAPAEVSVVVLDEALKGAAARVARWDFTAAETAAMFRRSASSRAIHLTMAWPADPPAHNKLHLFVRYVTADGRKLETDQPIEVALPGDKTTGWTPGERQPESPQRDAAPAASAPGPTPHTATRSDDGKPRRPVWSPERR